MLIYHSHSNGNTHGASTNSRYLKQRVTIKRKSYKSASRSANIPCSRTCSVVRRGSTTTTKKKTISNKNAEFLKGLGLKVKQNS